MGHRRRWALAAAAAVAVGFRALPVPRFHAPYSPILLARDGQLLDAKRAADGQWRFPPGPALPSKFMTALLVQEDKRFDSHHGIDFLALARAARLNLIHRRVVSGGSTLTMQTVRLARGNPRRSLLEKVREIVLALRLEASVPKREILSLYAAHAPFGENIVGLEAASWRLFGRAPDRLSWAESGLLAVLPNNPALVHAGRNRAVLLAKRDRLLSALARAGKISALELRLALREPLPDRPRSFPHFAPHLLETLAARRTAGPPRFQTTLDGELQRAATEIVTRRSAALALRGIDNAAALILDNKDGSVLAYVGNSRIDDFQNAGYAVDVIQRPRSTGSVLKPFLYGAMMQAGELLPDTLVPDIPTQFDGFIPENNDKRFRGAVTAREALSRSLNVPAVRLLREHGVARFHSQLQSLGMSTLKRSPEQYGLTLILGGAEGTLWDLTRMYSRLARAAAGNETITDIGAGAAWLTLDVLVDVIRPEEEGRWKEFSSGQRVAWKTGTSIGFRDGWALGVDEAHTVGVWTGNASGEGRPDLTGTTAAAPILFELFRRLGPGGWFKMPEADLAVLHVCADDGRLPAQGCAVKAVNAPWGAPYQAVSADHRLIHLDATGRFRVHAGCESVSRMRHAAWFALPPVEEFYYRARHPEYRSLPPWRPDCRGPETESPIAWVYPHAQTKLYIPVDLDGEKGRAVFEATDALPASVLHWDLDGRYLGTTQGPHQRALDIEPGRHAVTVTDNLGNSATRSFEVLGL